MPWTAADAKSHTKKADTPAKQKQWAAVANAALKKNGDEAAAIKEANAAVGRSDDDDDCRIHPLRGWHPGQIETRLATVEPSSYDRKSRSVDAVLSRGSPVKRFYGTETLRIHPDAVIMDRIKSGGIPILDSHRQDSISSALGRLTKTWFDRGPALMGRITFHETTEGRKAEGMVARGEISGVSAGYRVETWEIRDSKGKIIDPEVSKVRWDDELTFEATRWEVLEASLCAVPADASAVIRSVDLAYPMTSIFNGDVNAIRARMLARQHITTRTASP